MNIGKVAIQTVVLSVIILVVAYLLNRSGISFGFRGLLRGIFGGGRDVNGDADELLNEIAQGLFTEEDSLQAGCPTLGDIVDAMESNCFSFDVPAGTVYNDGLPTVVTNNGCFAADTVMTQEMCAVSVIELRQRIYLVHGIDTFPSMSSVGGNEALGYMQASILDSDLYAVMQSITSPTTNGYLLGQFGGEYSIN